MLNWIRLALIAVVAAALWIHAAPASHKLSQNENPPRAERSSEPNSYQGITGPVDYGIPKLIFVPVPYPYPYAAPNAQDGTQQRNQNWGASVLQKLTDDPLVMLTLVIALANIALATFAGIGIRDTGKTARAAIANTDALRIQLRANV